MLTSRFISKSHGPEAPVALVACPDCQTQVSTTAVACPSCGSPHPASTRIDKRGAWCPICHNRDSTRDVDAGFFLTVFWMLFVLFTLGLAFLLWPFLPKTWTCHACRHKWRA